MTRNYFKTNSNGNKKLMISLLIVLLTSTTFLSVIPLTKAAEYDTYLYHAVIPNPVGVGQSVQATFMMVNVPPAQYPLESPRYGYWENLTLSVQRPDGKTDEVRGVRSAEAGSGFATYTPTTTGVYTFWWTFPGQTIMVGPRTGDYYKPSVSPKVNLTVNEEPIQRWPDSPLPTDYWEAPIYGEQKSWRILAGNWMNGQSSLPGYGGYQPYSTAPNSAHVLWTKQIMPGGILDAAYEEPYIGYTGRRPATKLEPPIIMMGRLYYNLPAFFGTFGNPQYTGFTCLDLYTGETLWTKNGSDVKIDSGQIVYHRSTAQEGIFPYLWRTTGSAWQMYDAWTGDWILNVTGVASGTNLRGPNGEIMRYEWSGSTNRLRVWNSSKLLLTQMRAIGVAIDWTPVVGVYNYTDGRQLDTVVNDVAGSPSLHFIAPDLMLFIASASFPATSQAPYGIRQEIAYSLKPGEEGRILWMANRTGADAALSPDAYGNGAYYKWRQETLQWYTYNATTGEYLGLSEPNDAAFSIYSSPGTNSVMAYGVHFNTGYDGIVRAWDTSGDLLWQWNTGSGGYETPYGGWPLHGSYTGPTAADGKVFAINSEHTPSASPWRGGKVYAINATTGLGIWNISGSQAEAASMAIGFGNLVYLNAYDGKLYCFGKGPSAMTVTAPQTAITKGQSMMITGTVTDQSPGQKGMAAVSDESQATWMEYLHMQFPINGRFQNETITGVKVNLYVVDSNNNYRPIGDAITDSSGTFGFMWEPDIAGQYTIIAKFDGSESYGSSTAQTYAGVMEAPISTPEPTPMPIAIADAYFVPAVASIILAIAIVGVILAVLLLKKRN